MRGEVRRAGVWGREGAQAAFRGKARLKAGGQGTRGAHEEHVLHGCDAGRVECQRLVERQGVLPRVERRASDAGRGVGWEAGGVWGSVGASGMHGQGRTQGWEQRARAERTWNMRSMVVTLDV